MHKKINKFISSIPNFRMACGDFLSHDYSFHSLPCIYRSGDLMFATKEGLQTLVKKLDVQCHIDLRSQEEVSIKGYQKFLIESGVQCKHFPMSDPDNAFRLIKMPKEKDYYQNYLKILTANSNTILNILNFLALSPCERVLISCYAGKDRT
ncbi:MAG: tyrosine-protein phosphatase, partial [Gammaproteobacteria bacterium]|nr:tyrosine-protein phosphatase [Gammaproteobacteria bacterium]